MFSYLYTNSNDLLKNAYALFRAPLFARNPTSRLLLRMRRMYIASIRLDFK